MSVTSVPDDPNAFEQAISRGVRYWRRYSGGGGDGTPRRVIVDLLVDHPVYYLGNLVLAKYLELTRGLKPWALVSSAEDKKMILLARSFGIEQFTFVRDEVAKEARPEAAQILAQFEETPVRASRTLDTSMRLVAATLLASAMVSSWAGWRNCR